MEIANVRVRLTKVGSDVPLKDVTPAEALLLHILHGPSNGGLTFGDEFDKIEVVGTAQVVEKGKPRPRKDTEELRRLLGKYNGARNNKNEPIINSIWPDKLNPKLPQAFKELDWQAIGSTGIETAAVNYATGGLVAQPLTTK
jgi:hypothetical protein